MNLLCLAWDIPLHVQANAVIAPRRSTCRWCCRIRNRRCALCNSRRRQVRLCLFCICGEFVGCSIDGDVFRRLQWIPIATAPNWFPHSRLGWNIILKIRVIRLFQNQPHHPLPTIRLFHRSCCCGRGRTYVDVGWSRCLCMFVPVCATTPKKGQTDAGTTNQTLQTLPLELLHATSCELAIKTIEHKHTLAAAAIRLRSPCPCLPLSSHAPTHFCSLFAALAADLNFRYVTQSSLWLLGS